ncbi:hypothetical protein ACFX2I_046271 [Malus domestica]
MGVQLFGGANDLSYLELRNDHEEITEKLNRNIEVLHSARLTPKQSSLKDSDGQSASVVNMVTSASSTNVHTGSTNAMDVDVIVSVPFALVDEISDASPAAEDGLQLGDPCNTCKARCSSQLNHDT